MLDTPARPEHGLGSRIRLARELKGLTLRALAERAGISPSFLSQLENDKSSTSIGTARKLAAVLGITLAELVDGDARHSRGVLRAADRPTYSSPPGTSKYVITQPPVRNLEVYIADFEPGTSTGDEKYVHGNSQEILIVLRGEMEALVGDEIHRMSEGDSLEYLSSAPHKLTNVGTTAAQAMWITSPPTDD